MVRFGLLLHHVVNPVVMALLFFGAVLPMALLLRVLGKDLLRLKREPQGGHVLDRARAAGASPRSMNKQF